MHPACVSTDMPNAPLKRYAWGDEDSGVKGLRESIYAQPITLGRL
jgi:hypothetical protein